MRQNPHVRICGGPGSATTLVYPTLHLRLVGNEGAYTGSEYEGLVPSPLKAAQALVAQHAPDAPDDVKDEATLRLFGWLFDSGSFGSDERPAVSSAGALIKSGAASLLKPWRVHRAGAC